MTTQKNDLQQNANVETRLDQKYGYETRFKNEHCL